MSQSQDLLFQKLSTVQDNLQPTPTRIVAATTIAPDTFISIVTGTTDIKTVTPPATGQHQLVMIFTDSSPGDFLTTGNIVGGLTTLTQNVVYLLFYEPVLAKYYVK